MFTGIIEHLGTIEALSLTAAGGRITLHAPTLALSLAVSNSIAVNGCCLTIVTLDHERFSADLSGETIAKTSFGASSHPRKRGLQVGTKVNLEQPLIAGKEFGGHFVLGHVDCAGCVAHLTPETAAGNSWRYGIEVPEEFARYIVPQGSITVDGISLTVARWHSVANSQQVSRIAEVAVIPHTYAHTNIRHRQPGDAVNLEGDVLGKYVERYLEARISLIDSVQKSAAQPKLTVARLQEEGF